jgi:hypothetical protein
LLRSCALRQGDATEKELVDHLNAAMRAAGFCTADDAPVVRCSFHKDKQGWFRKAAFANFRSVEETNNGLRLKDLKFQNSKLIINR